MKYTRLEDLTVGQYQQLYDIQRSDDQDIDKAIASVAVLTGVPRWQVEDMPLHEFTRLSKEIAIFFSTPQINDRPLKDMKINGKRYRVILDVRNLTAGQYIDVQHFLKGNLIDNMHKIMACIIVPVNYRFFKGKYDGKNHENISEGIQQCKFIDVHSTCVFFSKVWNDSIKAILASLNKELKKMRKKGHQIPEINLQTFSDGYTMPSR